MCSIDQSQGIWEKLSQLSIGGAEYDSPERQPHPKCLKGTRVNLLDHMYRLLDDPEASRLIWLNGTAGVGKSAVAFTVAERMNDLEVKEQTGEKRLAGTFFFSRKYSERCTTGYFFATLAYQLARNFPSIRDDLTKVIRENPALLDPKKPLRNQLEALFLQPLRRLQLRLLGCSPLVFVIDALDECASEDEIAHLISMLGQALRKPGLPVIHILLTSRPEAHIREAIDVHPLLYEIPVKTSGDGITPLISLDGADVDSDIYIFLQDSFAKLRSRYPNFPQPTQHNLERLASRAGRRFIVASTMMKFIDDGHSDPRGRLQIMLELTSELLPGTEVNMLYDRILSTCTNRKRAYLHLSIVAALANPLPMSQISELLGPGEGRDVEMMLVQLRSVIDIPTDKSLPVSIYHSSVRDYALEPSNCSFIEEQPTATSPHSLLAYSSFSLMIQDLPGSTGILDVFLQLKTQSEAMESYSPQCLRDSLAFTVEPPTALGVFITLQWLRGNRSQSLYSWLETLDGRAWLCTQGGKDWLENRSGLDWLRTQAGLGWLETQAGKDWLQTPGVRNWVQSWGGFAWLSTEGGKDFLCTMRGQRWLGTWRVRQWLGSWDGQEWLGNWSGQQWLETKSGRACLESEDVQECQTPSGSGWLQTWPGREWLQTSSAREWVQTTSGQDWLKTLSGEEWLKTLNGQKWVQTPSGQEWLQSSTGRQWLQTPSAREWVRTTGDEWLQTSSAREWVQTTSGQEWLQTSSAREWVQTTSGQEWLQTMNGQEWLQTPSAREWVQITSGQDWLETLNGRRWLQTPSTREWLQTWSGKEWLQTSSAKEWVQTPSGQEWLRSPAGRQWLQTPCGQQWLHTPYGQAWQSTPAASFWVHMEEFLKMVEAINEFIIMPDLPAFQVIQLFKSLPDFLMFPAFLAFTSKTPTPALAYSP